MFEFLFSEVWWMEIIIAALITAVFTLTGSLVFYNYRLKVIKIDTEGLSKEHARLETGHKDLSKEHKDLSKENHELSKDLGYKVDGIRELIVIEQNDQKHRHNSLTDNQKVIVDSINNLKGFASEMEKLQLENKNLKKENQSLKQQLNQQRSTQEEDWEPEQ